MTCEHRPFLYEPDDLCIFCEDVKARKLMNRIPIAVLYTDDTWTETWEQLIRACSILHALESENITDPPDKVVKAFRMPFTYAFSMAITSEYPLSFKAKHQAPWIDVFARYNFVRIGLTVGYGDLPEDLVNAQTKDWAERIDKVDDKLSPTFTLNPLPSSSILLQQKSLTEMEFLQIAVQMAENIIQSQLPDTHEGRNTWLMNYSYGQEGCDLRTLWKQNNPISSASSVISRVMMTNKSLPSCTCVGGIEGLFEPNCPLHGRYRTRTLTFQEFSIQNKARALNWHGERGLTEWSVSDWAMATIGEFGELCNILKKLNRCRDGIAGNEISDHPIENDEQMKIEIMKELGGTFAYLDLLAQRLGMNLDEAVVFEFNRISNRNGFKEHITT